MPCPHKKERLSKSRSTEEKGEKQTDENEDENPKHYPFAPTNTASPPQEGEVHG